MRASLALFSILALLGGCKAKEYICSQDVECVATGGGHGRCVAQHCAYTDGTCPTGLRFDDTAGPVSEECVDPAFLVPDAGTVDADTTDVPAADADTTDADMTDADTTDADTTDADTTDADTTDADTTDASPIDV